MTRRAATQSRAARGGELLLSHRPRGARPRPAHAARIRRAHSRVPSAELTCLCTQLRRASNGESELGWRLACTRVARGGLCRGDATRSRALRALGAPRDAARCAELMPSPPARPRRVCRVPKLGPPAPARALSALHDSLVVCTGSPWSAQARQRPARPRAPRTVLELEAAHRGRASSAVVQLAAGACHQGVIRSTRGLGRAAVQTPLRAGLGPIALATRPSRRTARLPALCMAR